MPNTMTDAESTRSTAPLREAIAEYDEGQALREELCLVAMSDDDADRLAAEGAEAIKKVQEVFYELTKDRNLRGDMHRLPMKFMRKIATEFEAI